jgi:hypothetical protein
MKPPMNTRPSSLSSAKHKLGFGSIGLVNLRYRCLSGWPMFLQVSYAAGGGLGTAPLVDWMFAVVQLSFVVGAAFVTPSAGCTFEAVVDDIYAIHTHRVILRLVQRRRLASQLISRARIADVSRRRLRRERRFIKTVPMSPGRSKFDNIT